MPRGDLARERLRRRLLDSGLSLTVIYPIAKPSTLAGAVPIPSMLSPLTGPQPTPTLLTTPVTRQQPDRVLHCLWLAASGKGDLTSGKTDRAPAGLAWRAEATALAVVLAEEAALDPANPYGGTVLDGAEFVDFHGTHYRVLHVDPNGPSFAPPHSYYVWLVGPRTPTG